MHWINNCFETIFPRQIDYTTGAVNFSPAFSIKPNKDDSAIIAYQHSLNSCREADTIIDLINLDTTSESIAILVRSRGHLAEIIPALQAANIPYQAVEIDQLVELPYMNDLLALTAALQNYGDRLAWLSILRAPWCGLSLVDLEILSSNPKNSTIWDNISNSMITQTLSKFGQNKVAAFKSILSNVFFERGKQMLSTWIYSAWLQLKGPATLKKATDLDNVTVFFELLFKLEKTPGFSIEILEKKLKKLYAKTSYETARVQIMTIHKSKGLEFDFVILPSLEKTARPQESKLLIWLDRRNQQGQHDLLLAPIKAKSANEDSIYEYIRGELSEKQKLESKRLLYVAVTRTKSKIALLSTNNNAENIEEFKPAALSFLGMLWPTCENLFVTPAAKKISITTTPQKLYRVNLLEPVANLSFILNSGNRPKLHDAHSQNFGILIHLLLEKLSHTPLKDWSQILAKHAYWSTQIKALGLPKTTLAQLQHCIETCLNSPRAQWILIQNLAHSEYPFSAVLEGQVQHFIIDRTFVDNGVRWIIDYKTTPCEDANNLNNFLVFQKQAYTNQLYNYAKIFAVQKHPIKFGLYFPLIDAWIEWDYLPTIPNLEQELDYVR